ncbi:MAG: helix-turn-helix domain-containing protein [Vicinamibacterales bacterium]
MSAKQLVLAWQVPGLTPGTRLVLMDLADCADHDGRNAFRSERTIGEHTMLSTRTVKRAMQTLRGRGLIVVQELPTNRRSTTYELRLPGAVRRGGDNSSPHEHGDRWGDSSTPRGGDNSTPRVGDSSSPRRGDTSSPLGVTSWVTNDRAGGDKADIAYKDDPGIDPVDPGSVLSLLRKCAAEIVRGDGPDITLGTQLAALTRRVGHLRLPCSREQLEDALRQARAEQAQERAS